MSHAVPPGKINGPSLRHLLLGFLAGLFIFLVINALVAHFTSDCGLPALLKLAACNDDIVRAGWPFKFYEQGGIAFHSYFSAYVLSEDMVAGVLGSLVLGLGISHLRRRKPI